MTKENLGLDLNTTQGETLGDLLGKPGTVSGWRILAVDDELEVLESYQRLFGVSGWRELEAEERGGEQLQQFRLDTVESGEEGLMQIVDASRSGDPYSVVLLGLRMSTGWSGLKTAEEIRLLDSNVKIVMVTDSSDPAEREIRNQAGINFHCLRRPAVQSQLLQVTQLLAEQWNQSILLQLTRKSLELSKQRYELALLSTQAGVWDLQIQSDELMFDERWAEMLGYCINELDFSLTTWERLIHSEDYQRVMDAFNHHLQGKSQTFQVQYRCKTRAGEWHWVQDTGRVVERDESREPIRMVGTRLDIHQQKTQEQEKELERRVALRTAALLVEAEKKREIVEARERDSIAFRKVRYLGRVLVAEDIPVLQTLIRRFLEGMGVEVEIAKSGAEVGSWRYPGRLI